MATVDYSKFQRLGKKQITKFGFTATIRRTTNSGDDFNPTQSVTETQITVVDLGNVVVSENKAENVAVRERQFVMTNEFTPIKGDVIVVGDDKFEIIRVDTVAPGNVDIIHQVAVKT